MHGEAPLAIGQPEGNVQGIRVADYGAGFYQAAHAHLRIQRRFPCGNLLRGVEQVDVLTQRIKHQATGNAQPDQNGEYHQKTLLTYRIHHLPQVFAQCVAGGAAFLEPAP